MINDAEDSHPLEDRTNFPSLENLRVLLVDDNEDSLFLTMFILESNGFQVTTATSVSQALETIKQLKFDILISDLAMPEVDGYSLVRKIRNSTLSEEREIPAIALTALSSDESRSMALASGFQSYVTKPVEPIVLLSEINRVISNNQQIK